MMKYKYILPLCVVGLLTACDDDLGNYTYHDINEVSFLDPETGTSYTRIAYVDSLNITPQIESTLSKDESNYEFEWKFLPAGKDFSDIDDIDATVVSRERNLKMFVTLSAGDYSAFYTITDKNTGIKWINRFNLTVKSLTGEGWMILSDSNGKPRMDMIFNSTEDDDIVAHDIWADCEYDAGKPIRLIYNYHLNETASLLVTDKGTYHLDKTDLHFGDDNNLKWRFGATPESISVVASGMSQAYSAQSVWAIIDDNSDLYMLNRSESGSVFEYPINSIDGKQPFKAAPFIGISYDSNYSGGSYGCIPLVLYDATNRQFLNLKGGESYPSVMTFTGTELFPAKTGYDLVHMESTRGAGLTGCIYAILKDPNSSRHFFCEIKPCAKVISAQYWWENDTYQEYNKQNRYGEILGEGLENATKFACHYLYPYVFYVSGNSIYQFDMGHPDQVAQKVLSFPGEQIKVMRFNPFVGYIAYADWERERGYQLIVGTTVDGEPDDKCGVMRVYNVPNLMEPLVLKKEFKDLGKIIDIVYKEQSKY